MWLPTAFENSPGLLGWAAAAALLEAGAYLSMASERLRALWTPAHLVLFAPLPYLLYALPCGVFAPASMLAILAASAIAAWWYALWPRQRWSDALYVALMAAPLIFKVFPFIYDPPVPDVRLDFLGQLLWIRTGVVTLLRERNPEGVHFGFWPDAREWRVGAVWYAALLPAVFALAWLTGFAQPAWPPWNWRETLLRAAATFIGILWVVALSEEFFFRGLLQRWIGIAGASVLFGLAHLGFRQFPNWRFAIVAGVAGVFYGMACRRGGGIRAAMVTHALTVVTWRLFFR
ncbi:MAG: CPBP family intramembrane metalloprotease [Candidatus Solibacter usitatus]|nr:CPBP family intramembrane metalloprotease [Candidatus Solibacter usitatus]